MEQGERYVKEFFKPVECFTVSELWVIRAAIERLFYEQDKMKAEPERLEKTRRIMFKIWDMLDKK